MACNCKDIIPQSKECYDQMILVDIPPHMESYRNSRIKAGLSTKISIDPCIYEEMCELWQEGIITVGSCCGHNIKEPMVNVSEESIQRMHNLGYIPNHKDKDRIDTFRLKTV